MQKVIKSYALFFWVLLLLLPAAESNAARSIAIKEVRRGPGVNSDEAEAVQEVLEKALKSNTLFTLKTTVAVNVLTEKLGGCKSDDCYFSAAKEVGIELLIVGELRKKIDDLTLTLDVIDTKYGETVMELSDKIPGDAAKLSLDWATLFLGQLEPISEAAEEMETPGLKKSEEAAGATVILDDELSGTLTAAKSPYLLVKNAVVPAGQTLTLEKGVKLMMGGDYVTLIVYGQLNAEGTAEAPVVFKSAKKEPKNWDWDRIYFRSAARSYLKHCVISHSNFGVHVDNGALTLDNVKFTDNSISCVYALQSSVEIKEIEVGKGHIAGINADRGSEITVDSGHITNTARAVICQPYASLKMSRLYIEDNDYGVIVSGESKARLEDIRVVRNRVGVLSEKEVKSDRLFMIQGNDENVRVVSPAEIANFYTRPEKITAVKVKPAPAKDTTGFDAGFASVPSRGETLAARLGLLGQVSLGLSYRKVDDLNGEVHDNLAKADRPHQTTYVPGLRPELQVFMQSKVGDRESNFTMNGFGNYNRGAISSGEAGLDAYRNVKRLELFNLTTDLPGQQIVVGDFTENLSELSVSSRQIRGLKYSRRLSLPKGRSLSASAMFGQSSVPWQKGLKPDLLDSATTAERQQLMGVAQVESKLTRDLSVGMHLVYTRHTDDPILDPADLDAKDLYGADPKLKAYTGGAEVKMDFSNEFNGYLELDLGYADTLSYDVDSGEVYKNKPAAAGFSADTLIHHPFSASAMSAGLAGINYSLGGVTGNLEYTRAHNGFFAAGNPILHPVAGNLQRGHLTAGRLFEFDLLGGRFKSLDVGGSFDWEAVVNVEGGMGLDTLGDNALLVSAADSQRHEFIIDSLHNLLGVAYEPTENKFRGGLEFKIPISLMSIEPKFSYYYERKTLLKFDAESQPQSVTVGGEDSTVIASEYLDAEGRFQFGTGLVITPPFQSEALSNIRINLEFSEILVNDMNTGSPDASQWEKNDGHQLSLKAGISAKFLRQVLGNKLTGSYRIKDKKQNDEVRTTLRIQDQITWKAIPRKLTFNLKGYWIKTTTEYTDAKLDAAQNPVPGEFVDVSELIRVLGGEGELKYGLSSAFSLSALGGYEKGLDDAATGGENFKTVYGGLTLNYLF